VAWRIRWNFEASRSWRVKAVKRSCNQNQTATQPDSVASGNGGGCREMVFPSNCRPAWTRQTGQPGSHPTCWQAMATLTAPNSVRGETLRVPPPRSSATDSHTSRTKALRLISDKSQAEDRQCEKGCYEQTSDSIESSCHARRMLIPCRHPVLPTTPRRGCPGLGTLFLILHAIGPVTDPSPCHPHDPGADL
jgi:hypothetical protein